jgi:outer membrane protein OmpA-like peptidoglycan-associated protein
MKYLNSISLALLINALSGCTSWPEEGRGGWAESFPPEGVEYGDTWYWQHKQHLQTEFDHLSIKLNLLKSRGIKLCMPAQLHQASLMLNRIQREISADMLSDAQADLRILYHQLNQLERHFEIIIAQTQCVPALTEKDDKETDTHNQELISRIETLLNSDNQFAINNFQITPKFMTRIAQVAELIKLADGIRILLVGHADAVGQDNANYELAFKRAEQVKHWLQVYGVDGESLHTLTQGSNQPFVPLGTESNLKVKKSKRHSDRRVNAYILAVKTANKTFEVKEKKENSAIPLTKWTHKLNTNKNQKD